MVAGWAAREGEGGSGEVMNCTKGVAGSCLEMCRDSEATRENIKQSNM